MLARAVDAAEGLFVQEAVQAVPFGHLFKHGHGELVVVDGEVARLVDRGDFVLARRHLVVVGTHGHAELVKLALRLRDAAHDPARHDPVILILKFLPLGGFGAEERPPGGEEIGTSEHEIAVDEEKFLFQPRVGDDGEARGLAEELQNARGLLVEGLIGAQERRLAVKGDARPRKESRGDTEHDAAAVFHEIGRAGHIPCRIAARLEGAAQAAGGEA